MKIALSAMEPSLEAMLDQRFGRCPWFLVVETGDNSFEAVRNTGVSLGSGAGIQAAELLSGLGVKDVITGHCGPKAYRALSAAGIGAISGCSGLIRDLVEIYQAGELNRNHGPDVDDHFGDNAPGRGRGMGGGGRGMGGGGRGVGGGGRGVGGGGRGVGGGVAKAAGNRSQVRNPYPGPGVENETTTLTGEKESLRGWLGAIQERIRRLEKNM